MVLKKIRKAPWENPSAPLPFVSVKKSILFDNSIQRVRFFPQFCMGRSQPGDGHPRPGAGNIVQSDVVAEFDGFRVSALFAANPDFQVGA